MEKQNQNFKDYECIVIDDHSQDKSKELVKNWMMKNPSKILVVQLIETSW